MLKSRPTPSASPLDGQGSQPSRNSARAWRTARLLILPAALVATIAFSCSDDDESIVDSTGGSGGNGASGGSAGTGGSGGNGGSSAAGAAGMGGAAGSSAGAGGSAGSGNMAGAAGAAGTAGVGNDPDAGDGGTDTDSGTGPLTQQQVAAAICQRLDAVDPCQAPAAGCEQGEIDEWDGFKASVTSCDTSVVDAYYNCLATDSTATFDCQGGSGDSPEVAPQTGGCQDEQDAMINTCFN